MCKLLLALSHTHTRTLSVRLQSVLLVNNSAGVRTSQGLCLGELAAKKSLRLSITVNAVWWNLKIKSHISYSAGKKGKYTKKHQLGLIIQTWEYQWVNMVEKPQRPRLTEIPRHHSIMFGLQCVRRTFRKALQGWFHCRACCVQQLSLYCLTVFLFYLVLIFALKNVFFYYYYLFTAWLGRRRKTAAGDANVCGWLDAQ